MIIKELTSCKEPGGQVWLDLISSHKYGGTPLFQSRAGKVYSVNLKIRKKKTDNVCFWYKPKSFQTLNHRKTSNFEFFCPKMSVK